jgi:hypothetical protein
LIQPSSWRWINLLQVLADLDKKRLPIIVQDDAVDRIRKAA